MLLNLSNHPSDKWAKEQLDAAQIQYGGVVDMPFPQINPEATTDEVMELAKEYARKIILHTPSVSTVHLMGEMTFLVALLQLLQAEGIPVVCSTTERMVLEEKDGKKTLQFQFCRFREYSKVL